MKFKNTGAEKTTVTHNVYDFLEKTGWIKVTESPYQFTNNWFNIKSVKGVWDTLIPQFNPTKFLEIGSYEGASACYIIEKIAAQKNLELHCIELLIDDHNRQYFYLPLLRFLLLNQHISLCFLVFESNLL